MQTPRTSSSNRGFTLIELMLAMAITTIIVVVLVSITSIAMDIWNRSRAELRAARQAKAMVDTMTRDFEALITRRGNTNEWLSATCASPLPGVKLQSTNAAELIFFAAPTDRYEGEIGITNTKDKGGDVSCVSYHLYYKDPISKSGNVYTTFVLNRLLVNPDDTFRDLLGKTDTNKSLAQVFSTSYAPKLDAVENFVCENIFQFTVTFQVEATHVVGNTSRTVPVAVTIGQSTTGQVTESFKIKGSGIDTSATPTGVTADELKAGRITAVEVSLTVLSDFGVDQLRSRPFTDAQKSVFLAKNSFQYTKRVQVPGM